MRPGADARDDAELLRAAGRGDEAALAALYDRHAGWLSVRLSRHDQAAGVVVSSSELPESAVRGLLACGVVVGGDDASGLLGADEAAKLVGLGVGECVPEGLPRMVTITRIASRGVAARRAGHFGRWRAVIAMPAMLCPLLFLLVVFGWAARGNRS